MSRKKVIIQARELSEMDVNLISLVKRGANRVPFRIIKSDGDSKMLDLTRIFFQKKDAVATPQIIGVVLIKSADHDAYTKAFTEGGFEVDHVTVDEGEGPTALMFTKSDDMEGALIYKINDEAALVISDMQKGLEMWPDSNSFVENISKAGFAPSFRMANEILTDTIGNIMFGEGDADMTKSEVTKAIDDFKNYVEAVMSQIPEQAFKAEEILVETQKGLIPSDPKKPAKKKTKEPAKKEASDDDGEAGEVDAVASTDADADAGDAADPDAIVADADAGDDAGDADEDAEKAAAEKSNSTDEANAELKKSLEGITAAIAGIGEQITTATDAVKEELSGRLDDLEAKVKKTDEALAGTVHSEEADDSIPVTTKKTQGSEEVSWDSVLDFGDAEVN